MRQFMPSRGFIVLSGITAIAVGFRAADLLPSRDQTPRELAARFLSEAGVTSTESPVSEIAAELFTDVAGQLGLHFTHDNAARGNYYLPEEMGPGAAFLDYDNDGDLDIFVTGGGAIVNDGPTQSCRLFHNDSGRFSDVTAEANAGVAGPAYGVACADYDEDGDVDIFISRLGPNALLRNEGNGRFVEIAQELGLADDGFGASAAFLDYDRDGRLDLYVANYVRWTEEAETPCYTILGIQDYCNPQVYNAPSSDKLYRNLGNGRFEDVSDAAGIGSEAGNGLGVLVSDFNGDGWPDIYVANDQTPAFLWHNNGDGTFDNRATLAGCAYDARGVAIAGMGVAGEDLDGDGDIDLIVANIRDQMNLVLRNDGGVFQDVSSLMGMAAWSTPSTAFGVVIFDQDHDGHLDGFFANGDVNRSTDPQSNTSPYAQPDQFVRFDDTRFIDVSAALGMTVIDVGRAVAKGDYDNDGDLDLLVTNNGGALRLLQNNNSTANAWLIIDARTGPSARAAIGARVRATVGHTTFVREIRPQHSYLSSSDPRAHFGLASASRVDRLVVDWVDGTQSVLVELDVDQVLVIRQETPAGIEGQ